MGVMVILLEILDNRIILPNKLGCRKPQLRAGRRGRLGTCSFSWQSVWDEQEWREWKRRLK